MKTQLLDYLLSTIALGLLAVISLLITAFIFNDATTSVLGAYAVIVNCLLFLLVFGVLSALGTRSIMKYKPLLPGKYAMQDDIFTWWKLFTVIYEFGRGALLPFSTVFAKPLIVSLFGAKIGKDIALGGHLVDPELIEIGDEAIIGQDSVISAHTITSGYLILGSVKIGARATVGVNSVVMSGVEIGVGSVLTAGSVVPPDTMIPARELWGGSPAVKIKSLEDDE